MIHPRYRSLALFAVLSLVSAAAGYAIYAGERKLLALLGLFTLHVLLRRWHYRDFYLLLLLCIALSHFRHAGIKDEFDRDKWLALFAMAALSLVTVLLKWRSRPWPSWVHLPAFGTFAVVLWSVTISQHQWFTFKYAGVFGLGMVVAFVGAWSYSSSTRNARNVLDAQVDSLWLVFPLGLLVLVLPLPGKFEGLMRYRSVYDNANALGVWTSTCMPLLFGFALSHPVPWRRWLCRGFLASGLIVGFLSGSRGGVGGAIIGIGAYCLLRWPRRMLAIGLLSLVCGGFLIAYEVELGAIGRVTENLVRPDSLETLSDRAISWEHAIFIGDQRPWLGHGVGLDHQLYHDYGFDYFLGHVPPAVHSTYLAGYMCVGLLGTGLLVLSMLTGLAFGLETWRRDRRGERGLMALALVAVILAGAAHGVVENIFWSMGNPWSLPYWTAIALAGRLWVLQRRERREPARLAAASAQRSDLAPFLTLSTPLRPERLPAA